MEKDLEKNILDYSVLELLDLVKDNKVSKKEIYKAYLESIEKNDPKVHAYLSVEKEVKDKIPVAIKDNINVKDTYTTCASKMLESYKSPYDATIIKKIKESGVFDVIGKVNMDEFAFGSSTENSAFGTTLNPHDTTKVSGGSSGGSAACVANKTAPIAIGSDTGGSVRQPASYCGIVGLKPSYGTVSRYGVTSFASSFDQVGILAQNVKDAAYMLNIIKGADNFDDTTAKTADQLPDYMVDIDKDIKGKKIAVIDSFLEGQWQEEVKDALEATKKELENQGCVVDTINFPYGKEVIAIYHIISAAEASSNLSRMDGIRFGKRAENCKNIDEIFVKSRSEGFGKEAKRRIMLGTYVLSAGYYDAYYKKALKVRKLIIDYLKGIFEKYDAILMPVTVKTAPKVGYIENNQEENFFSDIYTCLANIAALGGISIPIAKDKENMPIGMQFLCQRYQDDKMINIANKVFEKFNNK